MSSLLQFKAVLGDFEITLYQFKKKNNYFFKFSGLTYCAVLDREYYTAWGNEA